MTASKSHTRTGEKSPDADGTDSDATDSESCDTPAAHIQVQAPVQEVRERVQSAEGVVTVKLDSDDVSAMVIYDPSDAEALADRLLTCAETAREWDGYDD